MVGGSGEARLCCAGPCLVLNTRQLQPTWRDVKLFKQVKEEKKVHKLVHVKGDEQMADSLTKLGAREVDLIETLNRGNFFN